MYKSKRAEFCDRDKTLHLWNPLHKFYVFQIFQFLAVLDCIDIYLTNEIVEDFLGKKLRLMSGLIDLTLYDTRKLKLLVQKVKRLIWGIGVSSKYFHTLNKWLMFNLQLLLIEQTYIPVLCNFRLARNYSYLTRKWDYIPYIR